MHNIRIHYKDPHRSNYERLISRTVTFLTLTASVMFLYIWKNAPERINTTLLFSSLLFLVIQYPIFRLLHLRERKRVISLEGNSISYYKGKKKKTIELNSTLSISAKSILGFLPYITLENKGESCSIPVIMDGVEQLPEHILEHKKDRKALREFILYYKSIGKYIDQMSKYARQAFPFLTLFGFSASYFVWDYPLEVCLFWLLVSYVMPMFSVTTAYLLLKIVVSGSHSKKRRTLAVGVATYITCTVYLIYGVLFKDMLVT